MIPYIIVLFVAIVIAYVATKLFEHKMNKLGCLSLFILAILLAVFAGIRSPELGHDIRLYFYNVFQEASRRNFSSYLKYMNSYHMENGFLLLTYILTSLSKNINFALFGIQLAVSAPVIYFIFAKKEKIGIVLPVIIYYCTLYLYSFNILRQSIALGIMLVSIILFERKKSVLAILMLVLAAQFHNSVIFAIPSFLLMRIMDSGKISQKSKNLLLLIAVPITIALVISYQYVITAAGNTGLITQRYAFYADSSSTDNRGSINIEWSMLIMKTATMTLALLFLRLRRLAKAERKEGQKWLLLLAIDYVVTFLSFKLANTDRITWYMFYPALFCLIPKTTKIFESKKGQAVPIIMVSLVYLMFMLEKLMTNQYLIVPYRIGL